MASISPSPSSVGTEAPPKKLYKLTALLWKVFEAAPAWSIRESQISQTFQKVHHRNLRLREYGCTTITELVAKLPIFAEQHGKLTNQVSLSKPRVLKFLLIPVLTFRGGTVSEHELMRIFQDVTGLEAQFLYEVVPEATTLHDLGKHIVKKAPQTFNLRQEATGWILQLVSHPMVLHQRPHSVPQVAAQRGMDPTERFPNAGQSHDEYFLPRDPAFRPDMKPFDPPRTVALPSFARGQRLDSKEKAVEKINRTLDEIIDDLSSRNKFVPEREVKKLLDELLHHAYQRRVGRIGFRDISAWGEYTKLHGRVDELIKVFCIFSPTTSLYELERAVLHAEKVERYEVLRLGPLWKHPRVQDLFKPPQDLDSVPELTTYQIQKHLMGFLSTKSRSGPREKQSLEEFLEYVQKKEHKISISHLCIRISSFPLAIQTNYKFRSISKEARLKVNKDLEDEMANTLNHEAEKLKKKLSQDRNEPLSIRRDLAEKDPAQILFQIFEACRSYFSGQQQTKISSFIQSVTLDPRMRKLFLLAIYEGAYSIPTAKLMSSLIEDDGTSQQVVFTKEETQLSYQGPGIVLDELLRQLKRTSFPVDLGSLARIEQNVTNHFQVPRFDSLGNGSFLHFLASQPKAVQQVGGNLIGSHSSSSHMSSTKMKVFHLMSQLKQEKRIEEKTVTAAIRSQFKVKSVEDLGCGTIEKLLTEVETSQHQQVQHVVYYLAPLLINGAEDLSHIGLMSSLARPPELCEDALACLKRAPLLEDLKLWSHWNLKYKPYLGELSEFLHVENITGIDSIYALELFPGKLIRVNPNSSVPDFIRAVEAADPINTSGHLVSMAVTAGSLHEIPAELLANHVRTALEKLSFSKPSAGEQTELPSRFVFDCLMRIPPEMHSSNSVANVVFIEPLRRVTSSSTVDGLLKYCSITGERVILQALGMHMGIKAWADDFKTMLKEVQYSTNYSFSLETSSDRKETIQDTTEIATISKKPSPVSMAPLPSSALATNTEIDSAVNMTAEELAGREAKCKGIIESIRREEFGIGIELSKEQQIIAEKQRSREGRGLKRLSEELYSKDTHFVLELVQNADDNNYQLLHPSKDIPSLKFVVSDTCVIVFNNESGFSESNIRAICDVGKSTKGAHRSGYIGQKGIGFKSVFRVSNTPEIHSKGFHMKFDAGSNPIGYIFPHWIGSDSDCDEPRWTTKILLPLKADQEASSMAKKFCDIQPSLLLFLHRLRSITVDDKMSGEIRHMTRYDMDNGIVEIHHSDGRDKWLVVRKELTDAGKYKAGVEATELALAFSLPSDLSEIPLAKDLQPQQVFAFLPLRSYGFRFIVQGDFDLPSSREDVNSDSSWNQWLREEIPLLFMEAMEVMKGLELPGLSVTQAVALLLQFVPLEGELHDFFKPVTSKILHLLRGAKCLPSDPVDADSSQNPDPFSVIRMTSEFSQEPGHTLNWKQPSELLLVNNDFIRENIPQALLESTLSLSYMNSDLLRTHAVYSSLQHQLGVGSMTVDHLVVIAQTVLASFHDHMKTSASESSYRYEEESDNDDFSDDSYDPELPSSTKQAQISTQDTFIKWIVKWFACVHIVMELETYSVNPSTLNKLRKLQIVPLSNQSFSDTDENAKLFFPAETTAGMGEDFYRSLFQEMKVVSPQLFDTDDELVRSRVHRVLEQLGVKNLYPADIIKHHILPQFTSNLWMSKSGVVLCTYLVYIKDNIGQPEVTEAEMVHRLKECVVLITKKNEQKQPSKEVVHFSSEYKCPNDLEKMFPDVNWTVVSPMYLKKSKKPDVGSWRKFLTKLGVKTLIAITPVDEHVSEGSSRWDELREWGRSPDGSYTVRDYRSDDFKAIVNSVKHRDPPVQICKMTKLVELLDEQWETEYRLYTSAKCYDGANENHISTIPSSFRCSLAQLAWLPSKPSKPNPSLKALFKGKDLYSSSHQIQMLLGPHVPYLSADVKSTHLLDLLGIKQDVSANDVLGFLKQWSESCKESGPFHTSIKHMTAVYLYLKRESDAQELQGYTHSNDIKDAVLQGELIFVPEVVPDTVSAHEASPGCFYSTHKVCWIDSSSTIVKYQKREAALPTVIPKVLFPYYVSGRKEEFDNIRHTFQAFGVNEEPNIHQLIAMLNYISSLSPVPHPKHVEDFTSIALHLAGRCSRDPSLAGFIYRNLKDAKVFPTQDQKWVSIVDGLLENDNPEIASHFRDTDGIHFLQWPQEAKSKAMTECSKFADICQIQKLSSVVHTEVVPVGRIELSLDLLITIHHYTPLVQRYLLTFDEERYALLQRCTIQKKLERLMVFSVLTLDCVYSVVIDGKQVFASSTSSQGCEFADSDPPAIYIVVSKLKKLSILIPVLLKLFMNEASEYFTRFLKDLLLENPTTDEEKEDIIDKYHLKPVPEGDTVWNIPQALPQQQSQDEPTQEESDSEEDTSKTDDKVSPSTSESIGGLKSWPPKASVDIDAHSQKPSTQSIKGETPTMWPPTEASLTENVIGEEEIRQVRKKHIPEESTGMHPHPPSRQASTASNSEEKQTDSKLHPSATFTKSTDHQSSVSSEKESEKATHEAKYSSSVSREHPGELSRRDRSPASHAFPSVDFSANSVDIGSLMQKITLEGTHVDQHFLPVIDDLNSSETLMAIGRWGEEFVYKYLKSAGQLPNGQKFQSIQWVNEKNETAKPYDIVVHVETSKLYIEVKSTSSAEKELVAISWQELKFAEQESKNYHLYRVYNAGKASRQLCWLDNLFGYLQNNPVRFFMKL